MSDSESRYDSEPKAFDGESSDDRRGTSSEALSFGSADSEDTEIEVVGERVHPIPTHGKGKGLMMGQPVPLATVSYGTQSASASQYCEFLMRDTRALEQQASYQSKTLTSGRGDAATESLVRLIVTIVHRGNPRILLGQPMVHLFGKLKQPTSSKFDIRKIERVKFKVLAVDSIYPSFLFTKNLVKAQVADPAEMTDARASAEAKKMSEPSKRRLLLGMKEKKQRQPLPLASPGMTEANLDNQTLADHLRKQPQLVDLEAQPVPKRNRTSVQPRAVFSVEDEEGPTEPVTLACPSKMAFMDMWLCMKRAITAVQRAKKAYEDSRSKVAEAGKAFHEHANIVKDKRPSNGK
ncbi:hypothetical protein L3X38_042247 [Prunus dulcis]|uniref:Uncharacterized protein n=1 Tax=Prunus dulcis TaxID=3755 RepID=A0AAD4YLT1_PRUDU|nr:hypothetical protein L3X38_042247 [Prunus dulcis]